MYARQKVTMRTQGKKEMKIVAKKGFEMDVQVSGFVSDPGIWRLYITGITAFLLRQSIRR